MKSKESCIKSASAVCLVLLLAVAAAFLIAAWLGGHFQSMDSFRSYVVSFGIWGPLILTLIQLLQVVLPVLPGFMGCIVGAALFGAAGGFWINYIGISAGSITAYWLARRYGTALVRRMVPMEKYESFIQWVNSRKSYTVILFLAILLPLAPDDFLCYFSGLTDMSPKKFTWIIILAKPWCILFYSIFFAYFL